MRKGGTRALIDMMRLHTRIKSASTEVHFFDVDGNFKVRIIREVITHHLNSAKLNIFNQTLVKKLMLSALKKW